MGRRFIQNNAGTGLPGVLLLATTAATDYPFRRPTSKATPAG